ncbi:MAG: hypothetical protein LBD10_14095 [Desulfobulbus sp.]|jgi:hypothetical protein|uniref:hypothetical protein n=1 Tax=Desulfobulbus sp. TaxID=895 RepID=UPI00284D2C58|nr:hypothetical protein [Desulfobulbus sp.]MDR2551322.1 hypothetical protein [Desulfobulbus sp.]
MYSLIFLLSLCILNPTLAQAEPTGGFPSSAPGGITGRSPKPAKPCREYLTACEKSCADRDGLFRFTCLGEQYNPDSQRYRCQCGDDAFASHSINPEPTGKMCVAP